MALTTSAIPPILFYNVRGRDGSTPKLRMPDDKCREAMNIDWFESSLGRRRGGASAVSLTGGTGQSGVISSLFSFVPAGDQSGREMWSIDDAATPRFKRLAGGTSWADVTLKANVATKPWEITGAAFNGKFFFCYDTTVNRLQVWDPVTGSVRYAGIDKAAAPTGANTGSGTYAATIRYYKVRWVEQRSSVTYRAGELSSALTATPSGSGTGYVVTQPTPPGEGETHWELFASPDGANYFRQNSDAPIAVATTTYTDSTNPSSYSGTVPPDVNAFIAPPSAKYIVADHNRLVMGGAWETSAGNSMTPKGNRFWWTAPLGATDNGDDERIENTSLIKNYDDIDEDLTGIAPPLNGSILIFSYGGVWKAVNTGLAAAPYVTFRIDGAAGCIHHKTIVKGVDENGDPCIYWLSPIGMCRFGTAGFQKCNEDIDDIWRTVNLSATTIVAHGVYYRDIHQVWWWVATGSSNEPDTKIVFDTNLGKVVENNAVRYGWSQANGDSAAARCSCVMSSTLGATMSRTLKPHIGRSTGTLIWKCDTGTQDSGTNYQAYVKSKDFMPWGLGKKGGMAEEAIIAAAASSGVTLTLSTIRDFGAETLTSTLLLTADGTETEIVKQADDSRFTEAKAIQFQLGDAAAVNASWNLDAVIARVSQEGVV